MKRVLLKALLEHGPCEGERQESVCRRKILKKKRFSELFESVLRVKECHLSPDRLCFIAHGAVEMVKEIFMDLFSLFCLLFGILWLFRRHLVTGARRTHGSASPCTLSQDKSAFVDLVSKSSQTEPLLFSWRLRS